MSGWRDDVDMDVRAALERGIDCAVEAAHGHLLQSRRLLPFAVATNDDATAVTVKATRGHGTEYLVIEAEHRQGGPRVMTVIDYKRRGWFGRKVTFGPRHESLMERKVWPKPAG